MRTLATKGLLCALLLTACGDSLPTREQVVDLRLLGVRLDPPSAAPGETVKASALIVDLLDQGYSQSWYACLAPSSLESYLEKAPDRTECPVGDSPHGTLLGSGPDAEFTVPETKDEASKCARRSKHRGSGNSMSELLHLTGSHASRPRMCMTCAGAYPTSPKDHVEERVHEDRRLRLD